MRKLLFPILVLAVFVPAAYCSLMQTFYTTNGTLTVAQSISNTADSRIAVDVTKQPASKGLTNVAAVANVQVFTGVVTNLSTLKTNVMYFTNGILVTNILTYP